MAKKHLDWNYRRKHRKALKVAMGKLAERNRCPSCERKAALKREEWAGFILTRCRWCGYEEGWDTGLKS